MSCERSDLRLELAQDLHKLTFVSNAELVGINNDFPEEFKTPDHTFELENHRPLISKETLSCADLREEDQIVSVARY
jgi:hypothetical protein